MNEKKSLVLIFILTAMLFFTGCSSKEEEENIKKVETNYSEKELSLPETVKNIDDLKINKEGNILLLESSANQSSGGLWTHNVNDSDWKKSYDFSDYSFFKLDKESEFFSQISNDGKVLCNIVSSEENEKTKFYLLEENKKEKELVDLEKVVFENKINTITFLNSKLFIAADFKGGVYLIDIENEKIVNNFQIDQNMIQSFYMEDNYLTILASNRQLYKFDIKENKTVEKSKIEKSLTKEIENVDFNIGGSYLFKNENGLYLTNGNGIEEIQNNGKNKKILSGQSSVLGNSNAFLEKSFIFENAKNIYLWAKEEENDKLYYYEKEEVKKDKNLKIYSLFENRDMKNMINKFSRDNPSVNIDYEIGIKENSNVTVSDAIKSLNTKILTKNSPDILILDGLNAESYIEKEVLLDLSDVVDSDLFMESSIEGYSKNSKVYAIPTKMSVPILISKDQKLEKTKKTSDILEAIDTFNTKEKVNKLNPAMRYNTASYIYQTTFFNNKITDNLLETYFENLVKANIIENQGKLSPEGEGRKIDDIDIDMLYFGSVESIKNGESLFSFDYITSIIEFQRLYMLNRSGISCSFAYKDNKAIYIPKSILSIPKNSENSEEAQKFIHDVTSKEYQIVNKYEGIPTNINATEELLNKIDLEAVESDKINDQEKKEMKTGLSTLSEPIFEDITIKKMILEEGNKVINNKITIKKAVEKIQSQLSLYYLEKEHES